LQSVRDQSPRYTLCSFDLLSLPQRKHVNGTVRSSRNCCKGPRAAYVLITATGGPATRSAYAFLPATFRCFQSPDPRRCWPSRQSSFSASRGARSCAHPRLLKEFRGPGLPRRRERETAGAFIYRESPSSSCGFTKWALSSLSERKCRSRTCVSSRIYRSRVGCGTRSARLAERTVASYPSFAARSRPASEAERRRSVRPTPASLAKGRRLRPVRVALPRLPLIRACDDAVRADSIGTHSGKPKPTPGLEPGPLHYEGEAGRFWLTRFTGDWPASAAFLGRIRLLRIAMSHRENP
jgi:hypothetical protein